MTISNSTVDLGMPHSLMGLAKLYIIMETSTKASLLGAKDQAMAPIGSIKSISTLASGSIIVFGEKENYIRTRIYFSKVFSKKD